MDQDELLDGHRQELRRGIVVVACLLALRTPGYGYGLLKTLERVGIPADGNTIYPLLRRLEERGLLTSEWNTDDSRPRKFYRTSPAGIDLANRLMTDLQELNASLHTLNGGTTR
jgi:PadR family transcriptional regulator, regulatory protein PadR